MDDCPVDQQSNALRPSYCLDDYTVIVCALQREAVAIEQIASVPLTSE
jgi:hypothetical protein